MSTEAASRVEVSAIGASAAETVVWRMRGELRVTVIVKAAFSFQPDAPMRVLDPEEIVRAELHHGRNPSRSVRLTSDLAPFLPNADVVLTGHACAPEGETALGMSVRLAVYREEALLDKSINVLCSTKDGADVPFETMPLVYERAFGGVGYADNPFGAGAASPAGASPNLVDPNDPQRVACFGPIARGWPNRKRLLGKVDRKVLDAPVAEVPDGFNFAYYQVAPQDQQIAYLQGNEWVVLEGMHRVHTQICSCLPSAIGRARVFGLGSGGGGRALALVADTLRIDADTLSCSVVWRGSFAVPDASALPRLAIHAGVDTSERTVDWPPPPEISAPPPPPSRPSAQAASSSPPSPPAPARPSAEDSAPANKAPQARPSAPAHTVATTPSHPAAPAPAAATPAVPTPAVTRPAPATPPLQTATPQTATSQTATPQTAAPKTATLQTPAAAPSPPVIATKPHARPAWDQTIELPPEPEGRVATAPAVPFRDGPVNLPPRPAKPDPKPDFSRTIATAVITERDENSPPTLPFAVRSHGPSRDARPPARARTVPGQDAPPPPAHRAPPHDEHAAPLTPQAGRSSPPGPGSGPDPAVAPPVALAPISTVGQRAAQAQSTASTPRATPSFGTPIPGFPPLGGKPLEGLHADHPPTMRVPLVGTTEAPAPAAKPKPEAIELQNETPLAFGTVKWDGSPSRAAITVIAKATCDLVPDGPATLRPAAEPLSGERSTDGPRGALCVYPSDLAPFKVRADVVLSGHAHAPPGGASEMGVRFRFGEDGRGFDRALVVLGDRTWEKAGASLKPSAPARFLQMPLSLDRAFGGRGFDRNPLGLGFGTAAAGSAQRLAVSFTRKKPAPLPHLEDPGNRLRAPHQTPPPACFAPLPAAVRERAAGKDPAARSLPERFDWTRFQVAPPEQRTPFLRGDEPFEIAGIHPKLAVLKGALPGLRVRCFAERPAGREEVTMHLDTAFFDLDEKTLSLVWRGVIPVSDEAAPDVRSLRLVTGPLTEDEAP